MLLVSVTDGASAIRETDSVAVAAMTTGENFTASGATAASPSSAPAPVVFSGAAAEAARAAILRFSSLTSDRNLSGVTRESMARTRSSSGGCVANHEAPTLFIHDGRLLAKNMCATPTE